MNVQLYDLILSYEETLKRLRKLKQDCPIEDKFIVTKMITSTEQAIEYMINGSYPRRKRAVTRMSYQQRTVYVSEMMLSYLLHKDRIYNNIETSLSQNMLDKLEMALNSLSKRERDVFIAVYGNNMSFSAAADIVGLSKSSVSTYISRAKIKLKKFMLESN